MVPGFTGRRNVFDTILAKGTERSTVHLDESAFKGTSLAASPPPPNSILKVPTPSPMPVFKRFPKELFRVNNGYPVKLRA
jgi:hypothetical protein